MAHFDIRRLFDSEGHLKSIVELDIETAAAVASFETVRRRNANGEYEEMHRVRLWDKIRALELLWKHQEIFSDNNGDDGNPEVLGVVYLPSKKQIGAPVDIINSSEE